MRGGSPELLSRRTSLIPRARCLATHRVVSSFAGITGAYPTGYNRQGLLVERLGMERELRRTASVRAKKLSEQGQREAEEVARCKATGAAAAEEKREELRAEKEEYKGKPELRVKPGNDQTETESEVKSRMPCGISFTSSSRPRGLPLVL